MEIIPTALTVSVSVHRRNTGFRPPRRCFFIKTHQFIMPVLKKIPKRGFVLFVHFLQDCGKCCLGYLFSADKRDTMEFI